MGFVSGQGEKGKQVVIFTFSGPISEEDRAAWNRAIEELKRRFGPRVTGVTLKSDDYPTSGKS